MPTTQNLALDTPTPFAPPQPARSGGLARGRRHRIVMVVAGIALPVGWLLSGPLLGLGFEGASYLGLDRSGDKAVIVGSDVANDASNLGSPLLANRE